MQSQDWIGKGGKTSHLDSNQALIRLWKLLCELGGKVCGIGVDELREYVRNCKHYQAFEVQGDWHQAEVFLGSCRNGHVAVDCFLEREMRGHGVSIEQ